MKGIHTLGRFELPPEQVPSDPILVIVQHLHLHRDGDAIADFREVGARERAAAQAP